MKVKGGYSFPESSTEAKDWKCVQRRVMLHRQVMVVARTRIEGKWKAYCFPCPGMNHDEEEYLWETEGSAIPESVARSLFGCFEGLPYST